VKRNSGPRSVTNEILAFRMLFRTASPVSRLLLIIAIPVVLSGCFLATDTRPRISISAPRTVSVGDAIPVTVNAKHADYYLQVSDFRVGQTNGDQLYGVGVGTVQVTAVGYTTNPDGSTTSMDDTVTVTVVAPPRSNRPALSQIESGELSTCGLADDGSAFCWGNTSAFRPYSPRCEDYVEHQLPRICNSVPTKLTSVPQFKSINLGMFSTCGITSADEAFCWGIGQNTFNSSAAPAIVPGGIQFTTLQVEAGFDLGYGGEVEHVCGIDKARQLWCWTRGGVVSNPTLMPGGNYTTVSLGGVSSAASAASDSYRGCALDVSGAAYCWGTSPIGDGNANPPADHATPMAVGGSLRFSAIASTAYDTCAIDLNGALYCWGRWAAVPTAIPASVRFTSISGAATHFCALGSDESAYCWSTPTMSPTRVESASKFRAVTAGGQANCAISIDGIEVCWGSRSYGALGDGAVDGPMAATPTPVAGQRVWP
jgi:hypothetical protein